MQRLEAPQLVENALHIQEQTAEVPCNEEAQESVSMTCKRPPWGARPAPEGEGASGRVAAWLGPWLGGRDPFTICRGLQSFCSRGGYRGQNGPLGEFATAMHIGDHVASL